MRFGIAVRFGLGLVAISLATAIVIGVAVTQYFNGLIRHAEERELMGRYDQLIDAVDASARQAESMAALVAGLPDVARMVADGERDRLAARFVPGFPVLMNSYGAEQFQLHLSPATSFLRVHQPAKFGDDLSAIRQTVVRTNQSKTPIRGLEFGRAGLGVRGIVPLVDSGSHVGSVEFGMSFGKQFFDAFKAAYDVDVALHLPDADGLNAVGTFAGAGTLAGDELRQAFGGAKLVKTLDVEGKRIAVLARPIMDFSGNPLGVIEIAMDASRYQAEQVGARNIIFALGVGAVMLASVLGACVARGITGPIRAVTGAMDRIARRDFAFDLPALDRKDEIGAMMRAVAVLRENGEALDRMEQAQARAMADMEGRQDELNDSMHEQLVGVVEAAVQSNEASVVLARMSGDVRKAATESQSIAAAIEEMVTSVNTIAQNADRRP